MDGKLTFRYDHIGDILYVDTCLPYAEQESEEVGEEIIARLNPTSGEVEIWRFCFSLSGWRRRVSLNCPLRRRCDWRVREGLWLCC
jgi:hypothetical protein